MNKKASKLSLIRSPSVLLTGKYAYNMASPSGKYGLASRKVCLRLLQKYDHGASTGKDFSKICFLLGTPNQIQSFLSVAKAGVGHFYLKNNNNFRIFYIHIRFQVNN